ncbi:MerR family transcriptional regulator [Yinghuangia sp. YIM S10712]|uniref:MerR family transcriptional regulator n=1 Tax=Yinghuangia sp. YIM S10712 TaxID=3436930 RepID=UPI003F52A10A
MLIGELSRRTGVKPRMLRYYEEQGLLDAARGPNGYREYAEDAVLTVRQVRALLDAGLSTEVIRAVMPCVRGEAPEIDMCVDVRAILGRELMATEERIGELERNRTTLAGYLDQP